MSSDETQRPPADDVAAYNRRAWDAEAARKNPWTVPCGDEIVRRASAGDWQLVLTPSRPVPQAWFPVLEGCDVLCLAAGGGQQSALLAPAGARVTVLDNSPAQLEGDRQVAARWGWPVRTLLGDMRDLSPLADATFDLIVHPVSNCFVPEIRPVWREAFRVLRPGGVLLAGFANPLRYIFDERRYDAGVMEARHSIPYSDLDTVHDAGRPPRLDDGAPLEFGHTLEDQVAGQLDAGFAITGFYEDRYPPAGNDLLSGLIATFIATRAVKSSRP